MSGSPTVNRAITGCGGPTVLTRSGSERKSDRSPGALRRRRRLLGTLEPDPSQQTEEQQTHAEASPQQPGGGGQQLRVEEHRQQQEQTPSQAAPISALPAADDEERAQGEGLPLRPAPRLQMDPLEGEDEEGELPQFSDHSDERPEQGDDQRPVLPVLHVVYHFDNGAICASASEDPLSFEEQGRLDSQGMGAVNVADVPFVLRSKYGEGAMFFGPRQHPEELASSGQSDKGSAVGAGTDTFDWGLLEGWMRGGSRKTPEGGRRPLVGICWGLFGQFIPFCKARAGPLGPPLPGCG